MNQISVVISGTTMRQTSRFEEVLENVEALSVDEHEVLIDVVRRRLTERRRAEIAANISQAQVEYQASQFRARRLRHCQSSPSITPM